jgi:CRISPR-associated endonuclease Csn1
VTRHVVGIDVGENSVGLASILCDQNDVPTRINRLLVVIHDRGKDGMASGQSATVSRKASGGIARRGRRLIRNRRKRAVRLARTLEELGFPLVAHESLPTYDQWRARIDLLAGPIGDVAERRRKLSIAIRHMSNHRGWANAWVPLDSYLWKEEPSAEFETAVDAALQSDRFRALAREDLEYQANLAAIGLSKRERLRPRHPTDPGDDAVFTDHLLGSQRRVDVLREWRQICRVQGVSNSEFEALARVAFTQEKPGVPAENVGNDWLPGFENKKRASVASLEHQEFQIRQTVANLAVRERPRSAEYRRLSVDEQNRVTDALLAVVSKDNAPSWKQVAEDQLAIDPNLLVHYDAEQSLSALAPVQRSVVAIHQLSNRHPILRWWMNDASPTDRSDFIRWFADPVKLAKEGELEHKFGPMFEGLEEKEFDAVEKLRFPSGRSAHSHEALRKLNAEMKLTGGRYVEVRNRLFGNGENLQPNHISLDAVADHPTLQRILPIVRRFLCAVERESGRPDSVVIEHVRGAFLGFAAKKEEAMRQGANRKSRERAQEHIANSGLGIENASDGVIRKVQAIERQGSRCLYCGATIAFTGAEMDHIVARASGGSSVRANLVAVCRECNAAKGKRPFAKFADSGERHGVSLEAALERVDQLERGELHAKVFWRLKVEMKRRLKQTEEDDAVDERTLASTAYAAVDMRARINASFDDQTLAKVYAGKVVSMARHASGIDKRIAILPGVDIKSRFDRRHHAIDAAVAALLNPSVARTLAERDDLRRAAKDTSGSDAWKTYAGSSPAAITKFRAWQGAMQKLAFHIEEELDRDEVVVTQPIRVSAHHGALHEDGRAPHRSKKVGDGWSSAERARVVDDRVYAALSGGAKPNENLPADPSRTLRLPSGTRLDARGDVYLFPDTSARIALPNRSSAKLGSSIHHIRLYRWDDAKGHRKAGVVRLWTSDLYDLRDGIQGNLLDSELSETSRAARRAHPALREALHTGIATHVGTLVPGDEILLDPNDWVDGKNELAEFLAEWPERHWRLVGWPEDRLFAINPIRLAAEGIRKESDPERVAKRRVEVSVKAAKVISDRVRPSATDLWSKPSTRVIRRTAAGSIRELGTSGLPYSWSPYEAVHGD